MSSFVPLVPHGRQVPAGSKSVPQGCAPTFPSPVRWTLCALAWVAFSVASYLAWSAVTHNTVAGCVVGSNTGCDAVLSSSWSKWLGIPIAVLGLGCYATLATLSLFLGVRNATANRWFTTIFVMLGITTAGASLWLVGIQLFVIGEFCKYCLVADFCGIAIGTIAAIFSIRAVYYRRSGAQSPTVSGGAAALRTTMPGIPRPVASVMHSDSASPWLVPAIGIAVPLIALLIGGQLLFASKTFEVQKVALNDSIHMDDTQATEPKDATPDGTERVAMRVPADEESGDISHAPAGSTDSKPKADGASNDNVSPSQKKPPSSEPAAPPKSRLVKFLGGKLTLDVYQHPVIGSREAPHIVIEMVSYDCTHCRKMFPFLEHALERYGNQVALLIMVQPLDKECNRLVTDPSASHPGACTTARLALGIARVNPPSFEKFHEFLMSGDKEKPPAIDIAMPKAYVLADRGKLREIMQSDTLAKQLNGYIDLYAALQKQSGKKDFGLPIQILGDHIMNGSVEKEEDVFKAWEEHLGVKPQ